MFASFKNESFLRPIFMFLSLTFVGANPWRIMLKLVVEHVQCLFHDHEATWGDDVDSAADSGIIELSN